MARGGRAHLALLLVILAIGAALRAINLGGPAFCCDELYDVFAARSWLAGGPLAVPNGEPYTRGWLFTYLTAAAFRLFGESEAAARLPALVFGLLTLGAVYVCGRALFDRTAALVALGLTALSPDLIDVSRLARLYGPLTFLTLLGTVAVFRALEGRGTGLVIERARVGWLALAAVATALAYHLHPVALALGAVVHGYVALVGAGFALRGRRAEARPYLTLAAALLALEAVALAIPAIRERLVAMALVPLPWYQPTPGDAWVYHQHLVAQYGWLWYLVWPATVAAVMAYGRAGLFVAIAFWLPFVAISVGVPTKHPRYTIQLLPFAWLLAGAAVGAAWPAARAALLLRLAPLPAAWRPTAAVVVVAAALLPLARLTPSVREALDRPTRTTGRIASSIFHDWRGLAAAIGSRIEPNARILGGTPLAPTYYLDRPTVLLVAAFRQVGEGDWETPERSATTQARTADDLARLRGEGPVWVVVETWRWRKPGYFEPALVAAVARDCAVVPLPNDLTFVVARCPALPALTSKP